MDRLLEKDRELLIEIISRFKSIIENKKTDSSSNKEKAVAWKNIAFEYNSKKIGKEKSQQQLKACYCNMKAKLRRKISQKQYDQRLTGGGPAEIDGIDENDPLLSIILPSITPFRNPFDSDGTSNGETVSNLICYKNLFF